MSDQQLFDSRIDLKNITGYMRRPFSMPGQYERKAAKMVSNTKPKFKAQFLMPCWNIEFRRVLQMIKSAHCTTTIDTKNAVWQVMCYDSFVINEGGLCLGSCVGNIFIKLQMRCKASSASIYS
uniref:Uncharacterized protein n=1 Tax=Glossina pallidipes TaxID=7398 RepID=A0A1A9ZK35_GLOPL